MNEIMDLDPPAYLNLVIIINMNIFEILASESSSSHALLSTLNQSQRNWHKFKTLTHEYLASPQEQAFYRGRQCWDQILRTSPEITAICTEYYISQLTQHLRNNVKPSTRQVQTILHKIDAIAGATCPHRRFLAIFGNELLNARVVELAKELMLDFGLNQNFLASFKSAYGVYCKDIVAREMIDLSAEVKQYIESANEFIDSSITIPKLKQMLKLISNMGLLSWSMKSCADFLNTDLQNFIKHYVHPEQARQFHKQCINYGRSFQKSFLKAINADIADTEIQAYVDSVDSNVYFLCTKYCSESILDIILDFPESLPTILSLKQCVEKSNLLNEISEKLVRGVEKRLLIPGVLTQNVLNQYINILKVLQILDPHGFIFERVTVPIKNYLLKRNDTLRCIISFLTQDVENYSKLTREVVKIPSKEYIEEMDSDQDERAAEKWEILAIKENKTKVRIKYQENDLVTMLVNLYGSQEAFINQYQNMLAEKLMSAKDYNLDEEIKNIELLKKRFGEMALQTCNIIVKDVKDSKRNDKQIHMLKSRVNNSPLTLQQVNCLAVSKGYWPINYEASSSYVPAAFKQIFDQYSEIYSKKKAMRKIHFHYNLGHVNLTLTFNNGSFDFKCMPVHAVLINCFDQTKIKNKAQGISSQQLSSQLSIPQNLIKQKMSFWVHKGVVKETRITKVGLSLRRMNSFEDGQVVYYKPVDVYQHVASDQIDDDIDSMIVKESTSTQSHLKHIIEGLIISILNINGPKSPQKIHLLLKTIYKTDLDYNYGQSQTLQILKKMVQKKKIEFNGQTYSTKLQS